jgi:hypothetical protein
LHAGFRVALRTSVSDGNGRVEENRTALHDMGVLTHLDRSVLAAYCGLRSMGRGPAPPEGNADSAEDAGRLCPGIAVARHIEQERGTDAEVCFRARPVANVPQPGDGPALGRKPWEVSNDDDEFFS